MATYFRQVPNFAYINRTKEGKNLSDYTVTKNLFKRAKLRDDIFQNLAYFEKYQIVGDERPDNVAFKIYDDETLDWIVLLSNNILDVKTEWPMTQRTFDKYVLDYDNGEYQEARNFTIAVTNFEYEIELEEKKRNIYVLKPRYLSIVFDDIKEIMPYKKGSQQYVAENLKKGDNIRLYE